MPFKISTFLTLSLLMPFAGVISSTIWRMPFYLDIQGQSSDSLTSKKKDLITSPNRLGSLGDRVRGRRNRVAGSATGPCGAREGLGTTGLAKTAMAYRGILMSNEVTVFLVMLCELSGQELGGVPVVKMTA